MKLDVDHIDDAQMFVVLSALGNVFIERQGARFLARVTDVNAGLVFYVTPFGEEGALLRDEVLSITPR